jgi:hypothetical protein
MVPPTNDEVLMPPPDEKPGHPPEAAAAATAAPPATPATPPTNALHEMKAADPNAPPIPPPPQLPQPPASPPNTAMLGILLDNIGNWFTYHPPFNDQPSRYGTIRQGAKDLAVTIAKHTPPSAEQAMAFQHLRIAMMWANAAIACNEQPPHGLPGES